MAVETAVYKSRAEYEEYCSESLESFIKGLKHRLHLTKKGEALPSIWWERVYAPSKQILVKQTIYGDHRRPLTGPLRGFVVAFVDLSNRLYMGAAYCAARDKFSIPIGRWHAIRNADLCYATAAGQVGQFEARIPPSCFNAAHKLFQMLYANREFYGIEVPSRVI